MRFAFFGDVVGRSGREGLADHLPMLRRQLGLEFVVINAENAAADASSSGGGDGDGGGGEGGGGGRKKRMKL